MNILITGDLHLTDKRPENRIDNFEEAVLRKFRFILETAEKYKCEYILQPGDFFDTPNPSYSLFSQITSYLKEFPIPVLTCYGQHDLRYRQKDNTALFALSIVCPSLILLAQDHNPSFKGVNGAGYNEEILEPPSSSDILITHRMIIEDKLWEQQTSFDYANVFLAKNKFSLIVSGDNHQFFFAERRGRFLFNCGSMMRSNISQMEHKPRVILFDTDKPSKWKEIMIPVSPAEEVFRTDAIIEKERNGLLDAFVSGLTEHKEMGMSFSDNLFAYMHENKVSSQIEDIIKEGLK